MGTLREKSLNYIVCAGRNRQGSGLTWITAGLYSRTYRGPKLSD